MSPKYLIGAIAIALLSAPLSAQSVEAGIDAWQQGEFASAVAIWRPLAEAGDPDAQFNLGQAYRLGRGLPVNIAESRKWFERAAQQGHVDAETTLGLLLFQNGEQADGLTWLRRAAEQDEPRAMLVYGTALYNGEGVTQDPVLGYAYVRRAAAQGLKPARETLAQLDTLMSADDRKQGAAMAQSLGKAAGAASFAAARPATPEASPPKEEKLPNWATRTAAAEPAKGVPAEPRKASPKPAAKAPPPPAAKPVKVASAELPKKAAPKPAGEPPRVAASGAWRIQLGAFAQKGNAEALYKKLAGNGALAGRRPFYVAAGAVTRLQVGPFESKSAAQSACRGVGNGCFVVPAK